MSGEAISSEGTAMYLSAGDAQVHVAPISAVTKALPAVVTVGDFAPTIEPQLGALVRVRNSGFARLDNRIFTIEATEDGQLTLMGANLRSALGELRAGAELELWDSAELIRACLTGYSFDLETPSPIETGTYCNPRATLPSTAGATGTATLSGWIDKDDKAYQQLIDGQDDLSERVFSIVLPQAQGEIVVPLTISGINWDVPLEGGMAFTATATLGDRPRHLFSREAA